MRVVRTPVKNRPSNRGSRATRARSHRLRSRTNPALTVDQPSTRAVPGGPGDDDVRIRRDAGRRGALASWPCHATPILPGLERRGCHLRDGALLLRARLLRAQRARGDAPAAAWMVRRRGVRTGHRLLRGGRPPDGLDRGPVRALWPARRRDRRKPRDGRRPGGARPGDPAVAALPGLPPHVAGLGGDERRRDQHHPRALVPAAAGPRRQPGVQRRNPGRRADRARAHLPHRGNRLHARADGRGPRPRSR